MTRTATTATTTHNYHNHGDDHHNGGKTTAATTNTTIEQGEQCKEPALLLTKRVFFQNAPTFYPILLVTVSCKLQASKHVLQAKCENL
jgi:hypothetical protein